MINLGDEVIDTVSGFKGVVTSKTEFLNGCFRYGVQPRVDKEGKLPEAFNFDEPQLELVKAKKVKEGPKNTGGPVLRSPLRQEVPPRR